MKILRAEHLGMCFGVRDAIALALKEAESEPLTILGELVHNETVLADLRARGVKIAHDAGSVTTRSVMITAHGASQNALSRAKSQGLEVREATCPLVQVAHRAVATLTREGFHPVIIGKRDHVEVRGLTDDLEDFDVVLSEADVFELKEYPRYGIAAQTTQPIERVRLLVEMIRTRFPDSEVRFIDTVCMPTKHRQQAAVDLAKRCNVVIVIGGARSNNTHELFKSCSQHCSRVYHVQTAGDLSSEWFRPEDTVGITAGTSTPDSIIDTIERRLNELKPASCPSERVDEERPGGGANAMLWIPAILCILLADNDCVTQKKIIPSGIKL